LAVVKCCDKSGARGGTRLADALFHVQSKSSAK
jgi:hypothetical protein